MKISVPRILSLGLLTTVILVLGCKPPLGKIEFNDKLARASTKMKEKGQAFRRALFPNLGKEFVPELVKTPPLRSAWSDMEKSLNDTRSMVKEMDPPRNSPQAEALKAMYEGYLSTEEKILDRGKLIVLEMEKPDEPMEAKKAAVNQLLTEIERLETFAFKSLMEAQASFAKAHYFKLELKRK